MPVRLIDRFGRFTQVMELTELMGHPGQLLGDREALGLLAIGDHASDRHGQPFFDLTEQSGDSGLRTAKPRAGQQHLP